MVLVLKNKSGKSLRKELDELLRKKVTKKTKRSWSSFFGKIKSTENPVEYQRRLRDE